MSRPVCVHADTPFNDPAVACGYPAFMGTHGFLCRGHFIAEQRSIPPSPRKPYARWKGHVQETDDQIIKDILRTEREAIAAARVVTVKCGKYEPAVIKFVA